MLQENISEDGTLYKLKHIFSIFIISIFLFPIAIANSTSNNFTMQQKVTSIDIYPHNPYILMGDIISFKAICYNENNQTIPDINVNWNVSHGLGSISSNGIFSVRNLIGPDRDKDTIPDIEDPFPCDFNNDGQNDSTTLRVHNGIYGYDVDNDNVTDYPMGPDLWLNYSIQDMQNIPIYCRGGNISIYLGPRSIIEDSLDNFVGYIYGKVTASSENITKKINVTLILSKSTLKGRVLSSGIMQSNVTIYIENTTNNEVWLEGNFSYALYQGEYIIHILKQGYKPIIIKLVIENNNMTKDLGVIELIPEQKNDNPISNLFYILPVTLFALLLLYYFFKRYHQIK